MNYKISKNALNQIKKFYRNVAKRYKHTWTKEDVKNYTFVTKQSIYQIENGLIRRSPTISRWEGLYMATTQDRKWNFAYRIEGNIVYIEDACHSQNMHESQISIRLTEAQFKKLLTECITKIINEIA